MKRVLFAIIILLISNPTIAQQTNKEIDSNLRHIRERDQSVRHKVVEYHQKGEIDSLLHYVEQMAIIDAENQKYVANLLDSQGIPGNLSQESYSAIFLVVDHADIDFQRKYFKRLKQAAKHGKIKSSEINTLHDRILMHSNRKQLYGTQTVSKTTIIEGEKSARPINYVWPVKRANSVDKRRAKSDMGSMQQQAEAHAQAGGYKMIWEKSMTIKQIKALMNDK